MRGASRLHSATLEEDRMPSTREQLANALDHPIMFTLVVTMVVVAWCAIFTWAFKAANLPGPAALFQHP